MKKRLLCLLALLLCIASFAFAEETAVYQPGSITRDLFAEAFDRGDLLLVDLNYAFSLDAAALGLSDEEAQWIAPVTKALQNATLTLGAAKLENGLRIHLGGKYAEGEESAALTAALDVTADGLSLESSFIPGERFTAKWETLLALAGMSQDEIAQIMSLRETGLEPLIAELMAQIEPMLSMAAEIGAPYLDIIYAHLSALPMEIREDVPAESGYPAASAEIHIQLSQKAAGDLLTNLADQLEQDTTLCAILDMLLAETGTGESPAPTAAELCAAVRSAASTLTDEDYPLHLYIGTNEAGAPIYANLFEAFEDGTFSVFNIISTADETAGSSLLTIDLLDLTAEQEIVDGFSFALEYAIDSANPNVLDLAAGFWAYESGSAIFSAEMQLSNAATLTEDGLSGYAGTYALNLDAPDSFSMTMSGQTSQAMTADGGEQTLASGTINVTADGTTIPVTFENAMTVMPGADGPVALCTELAAIPTLGMNECLERYTLYTLPYDAAALTETALETASQEDLQALLLRGMAQLEETGSQLMTLLPAELTELIARSAQ